MYIVELWKKKRTKEEEYERKKNHYPKLLKVTKRILLAVFVICGISGCIPTYVCSVIAVACFPIIFILFLISIDLIDLSYDYKVCAYCLRYIEWKEEDYAMTYEFGEKMFFCSSDHYALYCDELYEKNDER